MKEIMIITPQQDGLLAQVSKVLAEASINIEALEAMDVKSFSVLQLEVDNYNLALETLRNAGFDAMTEDVIVVNVKDEPGSIARLTQRLQEAGVHLRSARILHRREGEALVALSMERTEDALELIKDLLVSRL